MILLTLNCCCWSGTQTGIIPKRWHPEKRRARPSSAASATRPSIAWPRSSNIKSGKTRAIENFPGNPNQVQRWHYSSLRWKDNIWFYVGICTQLKIRGIGSVANSDFCPNTWGARGTGGGGHAFFLKECYTIFVVHFINTFFKFVWWPYVTYTPLTNLICMKAPKFYNLRYWCKQGGRKWTLDHSCVIVLALNWKYNKMIWNNSLWQDTKMSGLTGIIFD